MTKKAGQKENVTIYMEAEEREAEFRGESLWRQSYKTTAQAEYNV